MFHILSILLIWWLQETLGTVLQVDDRFLSYFENLPYDENLTLSLRAERHLEKQGFHQELVTRLYSEPKAHPTYCKTILLLERLSSSVYVDKFQLQQLERYHQRIEREHLFQKQNSFLYQSNITVTRFLDDEEMNSERTQYEEEKEQGSSRYTPLFIFTTLIEEIYLDITIRLPFHVRYHAPFQEEYGNSDEDSLVEHWYHNFIGSQARTRTIRSAFDLPMIFLKCDLVEQQESLQHFTIDENGSIDHLTSDMLSGWRNMKIAISIREKPSEGYNNLTNDYGMISIYVPVGEQSHMTFVTLATLLSTFVGLLLVIRAILERK